MILVSFDIQIFNYIFKEIIQNVGIIFTVINYFITFDMCDFTWRNLLIWKKGFGSSTMFCCLLHFLHKDWNKFFSLPFLEVWHSNSFLYHNFFIHLRLCFQINIFQPPSCHFCLTELFSHIRGFDKLWDGVFLTVFSC